MSQYSISLKSVINIYSHFYNPDDVFGDVRKKVERGRELFFNYDYEGDSVFKELFENAFIIHYLEESIYTLDADLFMIALRNAVKRKAPLYYAKYKAVKELENTDVSMGDLNTSERESEAQSETSGTSKNKNKSTTSQFPQNIKTASDFENVKYMDSGALSNSDTDSQSSNTSKLNEKSKDIRYSGAIDKIQKYMYLENDVINSFVNSFSNLFMGIW